MAFPDDLLEQAYHLANRELVSPTQASLRRAISTAYYALFHLLIDEAVSKWAVERHRSILARTFDHSRMKVICEDVLKKARSGGEVPPELIVVARSFVELQHQRHTADYDNSKRKSRKDAIDVLAFATDAFSAWKAIRSQEVAEDFLLQLFLPKLSRP
jgi:uncharacterized protein (UPF0332 family)